MQVRGKTEMEALQQEIKNEILQIIPDANNEKLNSVATYLTSDSIGVRTLDRLSDVGVDDITIGGLPKCDAVRLHRVWQVKFSK